MQEPTGTSASLLAPLLALVVTLAVSSVRDGDGLRYRLFVAWTGLAALGPIFLIIGFEALLPRTSIPQGETNLYTGISILLVTILISGTTAVEVGRGLGPNEEKKFAVLMALPVVLWYLLLVFLFG
ncbi:hypothetical protein [Haloarchaeobius sp. HME9146]|uniref:hypothetical protein n=1 Tax=Haloarchaeobius sp. HME9146 TaxID=2978732 RepID=UPI0021C1A4E4|nr:hypothetical protein [Haloarchaeobius sp. HME9146]MCT9095489.1 hypothetical protein [Haloarchaeobius sp. HME9146]